MKYLVAFLVQRTIEAKDDDELEKKLEKLEKDLEDAGWTGISLEVAEPEDEDLSEEDE